MNARTEPANLYPGDEIAQLRIPPHSIEAETSVLGGLLLDNEAWDRVGDLLTDTDFYRYEHRMIFDAIGGLINASKPADVITVFDHLEGIGKGEEVGGLAYLNSLAQYVLSASNIRRYAEIVRERSILRKLVTASDEIATMAFNPQGKAVDVIVDQSQDLLQQLATRRGTKDPQPVAEILVGMLDRISDLAEGRRQPGILTHLPSLDRMLGGGCKPGKQIVIAARPSIGKTALALEIARAFAVDGHAVGVLSQEMENSELVDRLASRIGLINLDHIQTGRLDSFEWPSLTEAIDLLRTLPLYVDDQPALTLGDIQSKGRKLKRESDIKALVVDYLQLCAPTNSKDSRHHQIEHISRGLKVLGKQLGLTTIVLSQLSREVEKRTSGRPTLADLKESGAIEEDADVIILLSKDHDRDNGDIVIHAEVAKNRGGKRGFFKLAFTGAYQKFVETVEVDTKHRGMRPAAPSYTEDV